MLYYNINNLGEYTNNEIVAKLKVSNGEWESYDSTNEEIIMQDDNSGYVLASKYIESLDNVKTFKFNELKEKRDALEITDIQTPYGLFDYDDKARERINAAIIALELQGSDATIAWTLADQTSVEVTSTILRTVVGLVAQRSNTLHVKYRQYHDQIDEIANSETLTHNEKITKIKAITWGD